jgi:hypothetical protein
MPIPQFALELENRSIEPSGAPTLAAAYQVLKREWDTGNRDREILLHLLFLAWYGLAEPAHITGFDMSDTLAGELRETFTLVHTYVQPSIVTDAEMLYVVGLMAHLFPYLLGETQRWQERSEHYRNQYRALVSDGLRPNVFEGRSAYGAYFAGQVQLRNGY